MLSFIYISQGFAIYPYRHVIERGGDLVQVRPKTFALLLLLLEKPREILAKSYLLDTIWDDVTVEEQVLVQSVRELRQLFGSADIIQTYPRKGYAWAADVEKQLPNAKPAAVTAQTTPSVHPPWWRKTFAIPLIALGCIAALWVIFFAVSARSSLAQTEVVLVLPFKNQMPGNDYNWIPLGAMDQLIHSLVSGKGAQVMPSEYVFQIMQFAHLPRAYQSEQAAKLFEVSGVTLVVESQVSGSIESYRLDYKLRTRKDVVRGVIFDKDLNQAINKLSQLVASKTGQKLHNADNNAQAIFSNELMSRGLEKLDNKDYESAQSLFMSLKQLEPNNLIAREQLTAALAWSGKLDQAKEEINAALELASDKNPQASAKMYYFMGRVQLTQNALDDALTSLNQADKFARITNEFLMQSEIASTRGWIQEQQGKYDFAQHSYEQSIQYDSALRCSIGLSDNHLKLAKLFLMQGKRAEATEHYNAAKRLINEHQLDAMRSRLESIKL
jgi:DNA-binding winged helix-turn-helix (wHTH) protein